MTLYKTEVFSTMILEKRKNSSKHAVQSNWSIWNWTELESIFLVSMGAGYQANIQLGCLRYFGQQYPAWETVTLMPFHKGRLDWIQTVSSAMIDFCQASQNDTVDPSTCRDPLLKATRSHSRTLMQTARGKGFLATD